MSYRIELGAFEKSIDMADKRVVQNARNLADYIAREIVNEAKSLTSQTKPGVNPGDGPRKTHPGGWADVTSQLANSIQSRIEVEGFTVMGVIEATVEYAEALNEKEGYEVLGGSEAIARKAYQKYKYVIFDGSN